jgi:serine/threonine protein phosphatase PrpC
MSRFSISYRTLSVPRQGEERTEDAVAVQGDRWPVTAAVADGATESIFAAPWAESVAQGLVATDATTEEAFTTALPDWQDEWQSKITQRASEEPWYVSAKAEEGAFAAVLGLSLNRHGHWQALSVGDCELFHLRDDTVQRAWPVEDPDAFSNRPALLPSRSGRSIPSPQTTTGTWQAGDFFLLATDAVAAWLLRTDPARGRVLDEETFRERVVSAREEKTLRNDDATLLIMKTEA